MSGGSAFTINTISFAEIEAFRAGCEEDGDEEGSWYANRALDQFISYRLYCQDSADVDALDEVCKRLNSASAVIAQAFRAVESYPGRRDWKHAVLESI